MRTMLELARFGLTPPNSRREQTFRQVSLHLAVEQCSSSLEEFVNKSNAIVVELISERSLCRELKEQAIHILIHRQISCA